MHAICMGFLASPQKVEIHKTRVKLRYTAYVCATRMTYFESISICKNVAVAHPRMARQGEVVSFMGDMNAWESSTNEPYEQTSIFVEISFSCRARGANPGPLEIVILQWPLHHQHTAMVPYANLHMFHMHSPWPSLCQHLRDVLRSNVSIYLGPEFPPSRENHVCYLLVVFSASGEIRTVYVLIGLGHLGKGWIVRGTTTTQTPALLGKQALLP